MAVTRRNKRNDAEKFRDDVDANIQKAVKQKAEEDLRKEMAAANAKAKGTARDRSGSGERIKQGQERKKIAPKDVGGPYDVVTDVVSPKMDPTPAPTMEGGEDLSFSEGFEARLSNSENAEKMARGKELRDAEVTMSELEDTYAADQSAAEEGVKAFDTEAAFEEDFKITHGGSFDPKSKVDKGKMDTIRAMRAQHPNATPAQLAVMIYRLPKKK